MTCIVGLEREGAVYMGCDSASVGGYYDMSTETGPKVFHTGKFLIGFTSSWRMGQILQYQLSVREQGRAEDNRAYMILAFAEAIRELMKSHGYAHVEYNEERGGCFLVGYRGELYKVQENYAVLRRTDGFNAIGCADAYALGALSVLDKTNPREALEAALNAAAYFSAGVRGPFHIEELRHED